MNNSLSSYILPSFQVDLEFPYYTCWVTLTISVSRVEHPKQTIQHWYPPPVLVFVANRNSWTLDPASLCAEIRTAYHVAGARSGITSSSCWMLLETSVHVFWPRERYSTTKYCSGQPPLGHASRNKVTDVELTNRRSSCAGTRGAVDIMILDNTVVKQYQKV